MKPPARQPAAEGAALVVTLIVVVALATVLVSFMQNTTMERSSSRSAANYYRAQLAAEAGLAEFMSQLGAAVASGEFTVLELADPSSPQRRYTALFSFDEAGQLTGLPLASRPTGAGPVELANGPYNLEALAGAVRTAVGGTPVDMVEVLQAYSSEGSVLEYPASRPDELALPAATAPVGDDRSAEFAYIAVDESAKLNVSLFGADYDGKVRSKQEVGQFAGEVALADSGAQTVSVAQLQRFSDLPDSVRSGAFWPSLFADADERRTKNQFYSAHRGQVLDYLPFGYLDDNFEQWTKMTDGGKLKFDINKLVREEDPDDGRPAHERIADIINRNLPEWHKRDLAPARSPLKPVNPELRYLRRIAAAITDYIDDDDQITRLEDDEPAGKELVAYPFKIIERYDWIAAVQDATAGGDIPVWNLTLRHTVFVELWNPHTVEVAGDFEFELETLRVFGHPEPSDNPFNIPPIRGTVQVALGPNEIRVYEIAQQTFPAVAIGANVPANPIKSDSTTSQKVEDAEQRYHSRYSASWNGQRYSYTANEIAYFAENGPGVVKPPMNLSFSATAAQPSMQANVPLTNQIEGRYRAVGDPRHMPISNYVWIDFSYSNANARINGANTYGVTSQLTQAFDLTWNGRDPLRAALPRGTRPGARQNPTEVASTYDATADGRNAVAFIRNGVMESVAELGHIYDPAHLNDAGDPTSGGTPDSWFSSGGGRTLRIGQPEFDYPSYDLAGQRSSSLLDLFTTATGKGALGERTSGINLNTAPEEVLTSFFYNLAPRSDAGVGAAGTPPRLSLEGARRVARAVIENRPYFTSADYHKFTVALNTGGNFEPAIGVKPNNTETMPSLSMLDRGREEIFRRAYNFLDTKSGAFKFYGVGRALTPDGRIVSEAALEAQVELRAEAAAGGRVRLRPVVTRQKFL